MWSYRFQNLLEILLIFDTFLAFALPSCVCLLCLLFIEFGGCFRFLQGFSNILAASCAFFLSHIRTMKVTSKWAGRCNYIGGAFGQLRNAE
jgi:hypothetical protein